MKRTGNEPRIPGKMKFMLESSARVESSQNASTKKKRAEKRKKGRSHYGSRGI
jgi:hypothetical protein